MTPPLQRLPGPPWHTLALAGGLLLAVVAAGAAPRAESAQPSQEPAAVVVSPGLPARVSASPRRGPTVRLPEARRIREEWSVVGVYRALDSRRLELYQEAATPSERHDVPGGDACGHPPPGRAVLPGGGRLLLLGAAFPGTEGVWSVQPATPDGRPVRAREVVLPGMPPHLTPPLTAWVRLFAAPSGGWADGVWRLDVLMPGGSRRYLYACVGEADSSASAGRAARP
ncbi:MAG TPA: hypothetical protein VFK38_11560 [Candidatus Limnocylindrales bacterium]|nr:hypothetical protein [Candidatus Limnocylindrales bacterium]